MDINGIGQSNSPFRNATFRAHQAHAHAHDDGHGHETAVDADRPTEAIRRALEPSEADSANPEHARQGDKGSGGQTSSVGPKELSSAEQAQLARMQARDREVRAHEHAHLGAAGGHAHGGASYTYEVGPDGKTYAVGGEVAIDMSPESTPEATLAKAEAVRRAALAPADPSSADRQIAAAADRMAADARQQIQAARAEEADKSAPDTESTPANNRRTLLAQAYGRPAAEPQQSSVACGSCDALHETLRTPTQ